MIVDFYNKPTVNVSVSPNAIRSLTTPVTVTWSSTDATGCTVASTGSVWTGNIDPSGTYTINSFPSTGDKVITITCNKKGSTGYFLTTNAVNAATVHVLAATVALPTAAPVAPTTATTGRGVDIVNLKKT